MAYIPAPYIQFPDGPLFCEGAAGRLPFQRLREEVVIMTQKVEVNFSELLQQAVEEPGKVLKAYSTFSNNYSFSNLFWAFIQCEDREIEFGQLATFKKWNDLGRSIKSGQKAIYMNMPRAVKDTVKNEDGKEEEVVLYQRYFARAGWFVMSQTQGDDVIFPELPEWNKDIVLSELNIEESSFKRFNGNIQGYAINNQVAINPLAQIPLKTLFHEVAHILLGHTKEENNTEKALKEVEAESVAMLCLAALDQPGVEYCRGYIQDWLGQGKEIPKKSACKIFSTVNRILSAGRQAETTDKVV